MHDLETTHAIALRAAQAVEDAERYRHAIGPRGPGLIGLRIGAVTRDPSPGPELVDEGEDDLVGYPP